MLTKYHKIKAPFVRDVETKQLTHKFILPEFEYLKDLEWIWTEKIDGTNIRIHWDGTELSLHGRNPNSQIPADFIEFYYKKFISSGLDKIIEQQFGEKEVTFFGEGYGGKIQNGGRYGDVDFILFDMMINERYMSRGETFWYGNLFGIDVVPVMLAGTIDDAIEFVKKSPHSMRGDTVAEGVVGTPSLPLFNNFGERIITKIKVHDFKDWE